MKEFINKNKVIVAILATVIVMIIINHFYNKLSEKESIDGFVGKTLARITKK